MGRLHFSDSIIDLLPIKSLLFLTSLRNHMKRCYSRLGLPALIPKVLVRQPFCNSNMVNTVAGDNIPNVSSIETDTPYAIKELLKNERNQENNSERSSPSNKKLARCV